MANQELVAYIRKTRGAGFSDSMIQKELYNVGWESGDIDEAFRAILGVPANPASQTAKIEAVPGEPAISVKETAAPLSSVPAQAVQPAQNPAVAKGRMVTRPPAEFFSNPPSTLYVPQEAGSSFWHRKKVFVIIGVLILLAIIAPFAYWFLLGFIQGLG